MSKVVISEEWTSDLAYVIGLIATDGSLSKDRRHIDFTSKDIAQVKNFMRILNLKNKIGKKGSSTTTGKKYYHVQFGNVKFYHFLESIGLFSNKSKTLKEIKVPDEYLIDYIRGAFDGDGYTYSYWDKRWKNSFVMYYGFVSASIKYLRWLKTKISTLYHEEGNIRRGGRTAYLLSYGKYASIRLIKKMYYKQGLVCLYRKKFKIDQSLGIIRHQARVAKLVDAQV